MVWDYSAIPDHLKVRLEVVNEKDQTIASARSMDGISAEVKAKIKEAEKKHRKDVNDKDAWSEAQKKWGRPTITEWDFGDLPERVEVSQLGGVPVYGYPGLGKSEGDCKIEIFKSLEEADASTRRNLPILLGEVLRYELAWLQKDLRDLKKLAPLCVTFLHQDTLQKHAYVHLCKHLYRSDQVLPLKQKRFERLVERFRKEVKGIVPLLSDLLETVFKSRQLLSVEKRGYPGMADDLARLLPKDFLLKTPYCQLKEYPRYLQSMQIRRKRFVNDPPKDAKRAEKLSQYKQQYLKWLRESEMPPAALGFLRQLRWQLEELQVSLFAQELGTSISISPRKVEDQIAKIKRIVNPPSADETAKSNPVIDLKAFKIGREF